MRTIRFRHAAPLAVLMMLVSMAPFDAGGADETKRPARRQAADGVMGAPKRQAAGVTVGAPRKQVAGAAVGAPKRRPEGHPAGAATARAAHADSAQAPAPDSGAARGAVHSDSTHGHAKPAKPATRAGADRDSSAKPAKPAERDEPKEEPPVRGPRMPIWPGISHANPSAGHEMLAAAW